MAVARALTRLIERIAREGGKRLRPYDSRRTFRTMLSRIGVAPHVAELCMNHQETETMRRVYDGHDYRAEMTEGWDKAGAHIAALRSGGRSTFPLPRGVPSKSSHEVSRVGSNRRPKDHGLGVFGR